MALTQTDIDTLEKAIASGVKRVKFSDRETEYRDLKEMKDTLAFMKSRVSGGNRKPYAPAYKRGYQA